MKNIILFVLFILGIVFVQFVQGQTADSIINRYINARGGKEKLLAIQTVYMEGSRQMMGNEVPVKVNIVQGKLFRNDFEFGGTTGYMIITPTEGWSFIPMRSTTPDAIPADRLKSLQYQLDIPGALVNYAAKGSTVALAGKDTLDGAECWVVKLTNNEGKVLTYYIDTKTSLLNTTKQMTTAMGPQGKEREVTTKYADYSAVDGVMFPHTISNPGQGPNAGSTTFDKIEINKPVDQSLYKPNN